MSDSHWPDQSTRDRYYARFVDSSGEAATLPILAMDAAAAKRIAHRHCLGRGLHYDGLAREHRRHCAELLLDVGGA